MGGRLTTALARWCASGLKCPRVPTLRRRARLFAEAHAARSRQIPGRPTTGTHGERMQRTATRLAPLMALALTLTAACSTEPSPSTDARILTADETDPSGGGEPSVVPGAEAALCDDDSGCEACQDCALEGECAGPLAQCQASFECEALLSCIDACGADAGCAEACKGAHPAGVAGVDQLAGCVLCGPCQGACDASCDGGGPQTAK